MRHLALSLILITTGLQAQKPITLKEAQNYALENNPQAKIAKMDLNQSSLKVKEFTAIGLPQVNAEGKFQHFLSLPTNLIPAQFFNPQAGPNDFIGVKFGTDFNVTGSVTVSQLLFDGSYLTGLKASKMYPVLSQKNMEKTKRNIQADVATAYYMAAVAEANVTVLKNSNLENIELLEKTKSVVEVGLSDSTTYDQLLLSVTRLDAQIKKAERDYKLALNSLKYNMGMPLEEEISLAEDIFAVIEQIGIEELADSYDPTKDADYQYLETQRELTKLNLKVKKSANLPSLAAFFNQQYQAQRNEFNFFASEPWYPTTVWGLTLNVPIFSSGQRKYQASQVAIDVDKINTSMEQMEMGLKLQHQSAVTQFRSSYEIYLTEKRAFELAQKLNARTKAKYDLSVISAIELNQSDLQVWQALGSYIQSMYALLNAKVSLDKITNNYQ